MSPTRKKYRIFSLSIIALILAILTTLLSPIAYAQKPNASITTSAYNFPIKPGTAQWNAFTSHDQMLQACQIPTSKLNKMSTTALMDTVLNYPLLGDMMAYNDMQQGFSAVATRFNGLSTLLQRNDAGAVLLAKYKEMNPATVLNANLTDLQKGEYSANLIYIETILAQASIKSKLTEAQQQDLITEAATKLQAKQQLPEFYGGISQEATVSVIPLTAQYNGYVYTPKGTAVSVIFDRTELTSSEITYWNNWVAQNYPQAKRLSNATNKYNCHSYAWYSQSSSNKAWMNDPSAYWTDGSYKSTTLTSGVYVKKACWKQWTTPMHSGIVYTTSSAGGGTFICKSKWGSLPLMEHSLYYCPYSSYPIYYYTR